MVMMSSSASISSFPERERSMSMRDVCYNCGQCGYSLNLNSSNRYVSNIGKKYSRKGRKEVLSFSSIDESRFRLLDGLKCGPYFKSPGYWGLYRLRTNLLCGKCGAVVGYVKETTTTSEDKLFAGLHTGASASCTKIFQVKIKALQPGEAPNMLEHSQQLSVNSHMKRLQIDSSSSRDRRFNESSAVEKEIY